MPKLRVGDLVTPMRAVEAYYSGYGGQAVSYFTPGKIGIVMAVDSPGVWSDRLYTIVEYEGEPEEKGRWRTASLMVDNTVRVKLKKKPKGARIFIIVPEYPDEDQIHQVACTFSRQPLDVVYANDDYEVLDDALTLRGAQVLAKVYGSPRAKAI